MIDFSQPLFLPQRDALPYCVGKNCKEFWPLCRLAGFR